MLRPPVKIRKRICKLPLSLLPPRKIMHSPSLSFFKDSLKNIGMGRYFFFGLSQQNLVCRFCKLQIPALSSQPLIVLSSCQTPRWKARGFCSKDQLCRPTWVSHLLIEASDKGTWSRAGRYSQPAQTPTGKRTTTGRGLPRGKGWVDLRWEWQCGPTEAGRDSHSVTSEVSLAGVCSLAGLPDFWGPVFGSALGRDSRLAVTHSPRNWSFEGKLKPVLCRGRVRADGQSLVDQGHLLKRRRCGRWSSGLDTEHYRGPGPFLEPSLLWPGSFTVRDLLFERLLLSPSLIFHSSKSFHLQSLGNLHHEALPEHPRSWVLPNISVPFKIVLWELRRCGVPAWSVSSLSAGLGPFLWPIIALLSTRRGVN